MADDDKKDDKAVKPEDDKPRRGRPPGSGSSATKVTNKHTSPLSIRGVTIAPGKTADVQGFKRDHPVMKRWVEAEVISVG